VGPNVSPLVPLDSCFARSCQIRYSGQSPRIPKAPLSEKISGSKSSRMLEADIGANNHPRYLCVEIAAHKFTADLDVGVRDKSLRMASKSQVGHAGKLHCVQIQIS
jgi:hypothetical protein